MKSFAIPIGQQYYPVITLPGRPKAILDRTAAEIYQTETRIVNRAVLRNKERFPDDFYFELTSEETKLLSEIPNWDLVWRGGFMPKAFTAKGMNMLSTLLKSEVAIQRSVEIIRAFTALENAYNHRDDEWDIITAKIIAAINNRLEDLSAFVNKKITSIEDRISVLEEERFRRKCSKIKEINDNLKLTVDKLEMDLKEIRIQSRHSFVDKENSNVDNSTDSNETAILSDISERQRKAVQFVGQNGKITNKEYRKMFQVVDRTALRDLKDLVVKGIFVKRGVGKGTHYVGKMSGN